ncbi:MAG: hypothetical protein KIS80_08900 [Anaerolineales bacterium]|nr:hypothetical protein [Anaerolineales bacterium]
MWKVLLLRLWNNLGTVLLAFAIAFAVWVSAVVATDPNEARDFPTPLALQVRNQDAGLIIVGNLPGQVLLRLGAPVSLWDRLTALPGAVEVFIDLEGLEAGEHTLPIQLDSELRPLRVVQINPEEVTFQLEPLAVQEFPVLAQVMGSPALGFETGDLNLGSASTTVSGPATLVAEVDRVVASLNIADARDTVSAQVSLTALDEAGNVLSGLTLNPAQAEISQTIVQAGGYREVAVRVQTVGFLASGFRVTSVTVDPPVITLFSTDSEVVAGLPGYVDTLPLDISGLNETVTTRLALSLPPGVIVVGEQQNVQVSVGVSPIETSTLLNLQVEVAGLASGLQAALSPQTVSVVVSGPLTTLQNLQAGDIRIFVDLTGLQAGTHVLVPEVEVLPRDVEIVSVSPSQIEVTITSR